MTRLIDADVVIKHIEEYWEMVKRGKPSRGMTTVMQNIKTIVNSLPTVDAEPVRHGVWVAHTLSEITGYDPALSGNDPVYSYSCSVCGEDCYVSDTGDDILSNYCPNCGARMDEE